MEKTLTVKFKLDPSKEQIVLLEQSSLNYINVINTLVSEMIVDKKTTKKTSKHINAKLNSAVKNQAIKDAKSVFQKVKKSKYTTIPILKKPSIIWNNQNYTIKNNAISTPFMVNGKSKKLNIKANLTNEILHKLGQGKLGTLRITKKSNKWTAQIALTLTVEPKSQGQIMGADLGILVPAVAKTQNGEVKFFGNGKQNKFYRRYYKSKRTNLGKAKKLKAIKTLENKEQRYMNDQDHKVSREIINFAKNNNVCTIRLECLRGIRNTTKISRKNKKNLYNWFFIVYQCI